MSGTIVGIVEKDKVINGSNVAKGDVLLGFKSNGLHTNGYSLARKVIFEKFKATDKHPSLEMTIGEELLRVHKSYLPIITTLKNEVAIKAFSHITGGGIIGNTKRVVPKGLSLKVDWSAWEVPALFKLIQETGNITDDEMREVFNIGIGLIAIVDKKDVDAVKTIAAKANEPVVIMGEVV
jgi:phosphoribosylformylglycinamidine cyclo-ligase